VIKNHSRNFRTLFSVMTGLSLLIACLGMFGLVALTVEQRALTH